MSEPQPGNRRGIPRDTVPKALRRWDSAEPRHPVVLVVRCKGRRILAAGPGDPAPLTLTRRGAWSAFLLRGIRFAPDRAAGNPAGNVSTARVVDCPNHDGGHEIDGRKLRALLDSRGDTPTLNVQVSAVEITA